MNFVFLPSKLPEDRKNREWRGIPLARAIQNTRHSTAALVPIGKAIKPGTKEKNLFAAADVLIVEADPEPAVLTAIQHFKSHDKLVLIDVAPTAPTLDAKLTPSLNLAWGQSPICVCEAVQWQMRLADAVLLHSARMAEDIRTLANGIVVPEYIDLDRSAGHRAEGKARGRFDPCRRRVHAG